MSSDLTPLAVTVLGLLGERAMHPYEMYQLAAFRRGERLVKIRPGSLYHTVDRLERDGMVVAVGTDRDGKRPERTTYEITDAGRGAIEGTLHRMLEVPVNEYARFPVALAEAHNLDVETVIGLLRKRIAALSEEIDAVSEKWVMADEMNLPRIFRFGEEYLQVVARAEREWLTGVIEQLETGEIPWLSQELVESIERSIRLTGQPAEQTGDNK
ncbi:PadR family transcriptional regulator [Rhodococcus sp. NPDC058521]|uniref:PadR family transcriptional regulator n=1 Tax=Rhodococcus sp. NPDC058521 TaxID=3346536 RepID=UPI00364DE52A